MAYYQSNEPYQRVDDAKTGAILGAAAGLGASSAGMGVAYASYRGIPQSAKRNYEKTAYSQIATKRKMENAMNRSTQLSNNSGRGFIENYFNNIEKTYLDKKQKRLKEKSDRLGAEYRKYRDPNFIKKAQANSLYGKYMKGFGNKALIGVTATALGTGIGATMGLAKTPE